MANPRPDIVCLSHLRWGFVHQRPQHLMSRFGRHGHVVFSEDPILEPGVSPRQDLVPVSEGVIVLQPRLPAGLSREGTDIARAALLETALMKLGIEDFVLWYYTPLALRHTEYLEPRAVVYDCMNELGDFPGEPDELRTCERQLLARADLVFTSGRRPCEAKSRLHPNVHAFPSSVDATHWDRTWSAMEGLVQAVVRDRAAGQDAGPPLGIRGEDPATADLHRVPSTP